MGNEGFRIDKSDVDFVVVVVLFVVVVVVVIVHDNYDVGNSILVMKSEKRKRRMRGEMRGRLELARWLV